MYNKKQYEPYFYVLDIETSTRYDKETGLPDMVWLAYGFINQYNKKGQRTNCHFFRTWGDLDCILSDIQLRTMNDVQIWVHNFSFEFDFLCKHISKPIEGTMLSNSSHNVISCRLERFPRFEFRCSYMLSNMSLRKLGEAIGVEKGFDTYDVYFPEDEIPESSKAYCCQDCDIVGVYIGKCVERFGNLKSIPFTKTGVVRQRFEMIYKQTENKSETWSIKPSAKVYEILKNSFKGGSVIVNPKYAGKILQNVISKDETSAYPYAMARQVKGMMFPRIWHIDETIGDVEIASKTYEHWCAKLHFYNLQSKYEWNWLNAYQCELIFDVVKPANGKRRTKEERKQNEENKKASCSMFNGKILAAKELTVYLTDIDFKTLQMTYTFDDVEIEELIGSFEDMPLPECYIKTIEEYSKKKFELKKQVKDVEEKFGTTSKEFLEKNFEYMNAKGDFNSIYGMSVMDISRPEYVVDDDGYWEKVPGEYKEEKRHLKKNFGFGVFITAYSRFNLIRAIVKNCPDCFVYCDTDSVKYVDDGREFIDTNERLTQYSDRPELAMLGAFDDDGAYELACFMGSKKYAVKHSDGSVTMTVAGLPKTFTDDESGETIAVTLSDIKEFTLGTTWVNIKNCHFYLPPIKKIKNEEKRIELEEFMKEHKIHQQGGIAISSTSYKLDMTEHDFNFIKSLYHKKLKRVKKVIDMKGRLNKNVKNEVH